MVDEDNDDDDEDEDDDDGKQVTLKIILTFTSLKKKSSPIFLLYVYYKRTFMVLFNTLIFIKN